MKNFRACPICHRYGYADEHQCPPEYEWRAPGNVDDWHPLRARDAEDAAHEAAEVLDRDHFETYPIASGREEVVIEVRQDGGAVRRFTVTGEYLPHYYASEEPA